MTKLVRCALGLEVSMPTFVQPIPKLSCEPRRGACDQRVAVVVLLCVARVVVQLSPIAHVPVGLPIRSRPREVHPLGETELVTAVERLHREAHDAARAAAPVVEARRRRPVVLPLARGQRDHPRRVYGAPLRWRRVGGPTRRVFTLLVRVATSAVLAPTSAVYAPAVLVSASTVLAPAMLAPAVLVAAVLAPASTVHAPAVLVSAAGFISAVLAAAVLQCMLAAAAVPTAAAVLPTAAAAAAAATAAAVPAA